MPGGIRTRVFLSSDGRYQPSSDTATARTPLGPNRKSTQNVNCPPRSTTSGNPKRPTTSQGFRNPNNNICKFFQSGRCNYGENCYFLHVTQSRPNHDQSHRSGADVQTRVIDNSSFHSASSSLTTSPVMSSSPLGSRRETSPRQTSPEADSSFVTIDSERHNSFETVSEILACDENEIGEAGDGRKLTKREKKKQDRLLLAMANKAQKKSENLARLKQAIRDGFNYLEKGSIAEGQRAFAEALVMIQQQAHEHSSKRRSEVYLGRALCHRVAGNQDKFVSDFNEASKDSEADGDFFVVTQEDFHLARGYIQILHGLSGPARECAIKAGPNKSKELSDQIMKFDKIRTNAEFSMKYASSMEGSAPADSVNSTWKKSVVLLRQAIEMAPLSSVLHLLEAECMTHLGLFDSARQILSKYQNEGIEEEREYAGQISNAVLAFLDYYTNDWSGLPSSIGGRGPHSQNRMCATFEALKMKQIRWGIFNRKLEKIQSMLDKARAASQNPPEMAEVYAASADLCKTPDKLASKHCFLHARALLQCDGSDKNLVLSLLDRSIQLQANSDALYERANLYFETKDYDRALQDLNKASCLSLGSPRIRQLIDKIKKIQRKNLRQTTAKRTFYQILGVEKEASEADIRKAYQSKAKENHPDRHALADEEKKLLVEAEMKCINEAYDTLRDAQSRRRYDLKLDRDDDSSDDENGRRFNFNFRRRYHPFFDIHDLFEGFFSGFRF